MEPSAAFSVGVEGMFGAFSCPILFSITLDKTLYFHNSRMFLVALQAVPNFSGQHMQLIIDI